MTRIKRKRVEKLINLFPKYGVFGYYETNLSDEPLNVNVHFNIYNKNKKYQHKQLKIFKKYLSKLNAYQQKYYKDCLSKKLYKESKDINLIFLDYKNPSYSLKF